MFHGMNSTRHLTVSTKLFWTFLMELQLSLNVINFPTIQPLQRCKGIISRASHFEHRQTKQHSISTAYILS